MLGEAFGMWRADWEAALLLLLLWEGVVVRRRVLLMEQARLRM